MCSPTVAASSDDVKPRPLSQTTRASNMWRSPRRPFIVALLSIGRRRTVSMDADQAAALGTDMEVLSRVAPNGQCPFCGENGWHTTQEGGRSIVQTIPTEPGKGLSASDSHLQHVSDSSAFTPQKPLESNRSQTECRSQLDSLDFAAAESPRRGGLVHLPTSRQLLVSLEGRCGLCPRLPRECWTPMWPPDRKCAALFGRQHALERT